MKLFNKIKTGWWPVLTLGILLVALWGTLIFNSSGISETASVKLQKQTTAYEEVLPNFLAPVIRRDVKDFSSDEEEPIAIKISLSRLNYLFNVWQ